MWVSLVAQISLAIRVLTSGIGVKACRFFEFVLGRAVGQGVVPPLSFLGDASQNCFVLLLFHFHFWRACLIKKTTATRESRR